MWELDYKESWVPKNWFFWTLVLEKTLESPFDCKDISPSVLKEISPECSLEGLMLKLKLQYFDHLMRRADSLEKTLVLGKIEGRRRRGRQRMNESFQARILKWVAISPSRGSSRPRDQARVFCIGRQILYYCTTWEALWSHNPILRKFSWGGKNSTRPESYMTKIVQHSTVYTDKNAEVKKKKKPRNGSS